MDRAPPASAIDCLSHQSDCLPHQGFSRFGRYEMDENNPLINNRPAYRLAGGGVQMAPDDVPNCP